MSTWAPFWLWVSKGVRLECNQLWEKNLLLRGVAKGRGSFWSLIWGPSLDIWRKGASDYWRWSSQSWLKGSSGRRMKCWVWDSDPCNACASGLGAFPNSHKLSVPSDALATSVAPATTAAAVTSPYTNVLAAGGVVDNSCKENELLSHISLSRCHCMHSLRNE